MILPVAPWIKFNKYYKMEIPLVHDAAGNIKGNKPPENQRVFQRPKAPFSRHETFRELEISPLLSLTRNTVNSSH